MATKTIDTALLARMFLSGAANLESKKEFINELNVFPVPDGDTGTNMTFTILSAAKEVKGLEFLSMNSLSKAISSGSLRGARGNSGVILSQLIRGFTREIRDHEELSVAILAKACQHASSTAYKAVMKPKEGTILTVAKGVASKALEVAKETDDLEIFFPEVLKNAEQVLLKTPDLLPILKETGVVDAGGQGLVEFMKGVYEAFLGKEIDYSALGTDAGPNPVGALQRKEAEIKFGYCTEFTILSEKGFSDSDEAELKGYLESIGDSIVCVVDDGVVKAHVHTNDPGLALTKALSFGSLLQVKIDNMREEHRERAVRNSEKAGTAKRERTKEKGDKKQVGFIAVSAGEGMNHIFKELEVDCIIKGGQTMNPSTDDILKALDSVEAEHVFVFPNNKNIILSANQAKELVKDKDVLVIPTTTIPQGITAILKYRPEEGIMENVRTMIQEIGKVKTGKVTYAVRSTHISGKKIHKGDIIGLGDEGIISVGSSVEDTAKEMLKAMVSPDTQLITLYYGLDVAEESAVRFFHELEKLYPGADVDMHRGGQPFYYYIISVE